MVLVSLLFLAAVVALYFSVGYTKPRQHNMPRSVWSSDGLRYYVFTAEGKTHKYELTRPYDWPTCTYVGEVNPDTIDH
jgi:hypothetical protein